MRMPSGILFATALIFGSTQALGQQGGQTPVGQPGQGVVGQSGQGIKGQPGQQGNPNPIGQPGMNLNGQPVLGQNGQPVQNSVGQPTMYFNGQPILPQNGQHLQNPIGQPGTNVNGQPVVGQNGQPLQNTIGQPGVNLIGQPGRTTPGQAMATGQNSINQPTTFLGTQNHFGVPLYQNSDVRRSLNLTDSQIRQLSSNNPQFLQQLQNQLGRLSSLPASERAAELQNIQTGSQQEFWRSASGVFTPEQTQRYRQLEYQYQGPAAFSNPEVRSRLNLTNDQAQRLQALHEQNTHWMQMFQEPGGSGQDAAARYSDYRQQLNEKTNAILTLDQRRTWQQMTGDPYDFRLPVAPPSGTAYFWRP